MNIPGTKMYRCVALIFLIVSLQFGVIRGNLLAETATVVTEEGKIEGSVSDGVAHFLGIPFAEPPLGPLR
jgi:para-nitrobenzyl esterase